MLFIGFRIIEIIGRTNSMSLISLTSCTSRRWKACRWRCRRRWRGMSTSNLTPQLKNTACPSAAGCSSPPLKWGARESRTEAAAPTNKRAFETRLLRVENMCGRMLVATANIEKRSAREKKPRGRMHIATARTHLQSHKRIHQRRSNNMEDHYALQKPAHCLCCR